MGMYLICPECLTASASEKQRTGFKCPFCDHAWEPPAPDYSGAYYHDLAQLKCRLVADSGEHFLIPSFPAEFGRDSDFKALQTNLAVSRRHFKIEAQDGQLWVTDLESRGGTYLNGNQLAPNKPGLMQPGDTLRVSGVAFRLEMAFEPCTRNSQPVVAGTKSIPLDPKAAMIAITITPAGADVRLGATEAFKTDAILVPGSQPSEWRLLAVSPGKVVVNGQAILEKHLDAGDEVLFGRYQYSFQPGDGILCPSQPSGKMGISAQKINFSAGKEHKRKAILNDVTMEIPAGRLTAIIGPSGSGKSTIVKVLGGMLAPDSGLLIVNGKELAFTEYQQALRGLLAFVPQEDIIHGELTVQQTMEYAATLRMLSNNSQGAKEERIRRILKELDIEEHREKCVNQLSGGQRKRVNVAVELLSSPCIIFLDEPTTGLDSASERQVLRCLKRLAHQGRTVVFITHSLAVVDDADHVVFIRDQGQGGKVLAEGPPQSLRRKLRLEHWAELFKRENRENATGEQQNGNHEDNLSKAAMRTGRFGALSLRYLNIWLRNPLSSLLTLIGLPALLGTLTRLAVPNDGASGTDRILFGVICAVWLGMNQTVREVVRERSIMLREQLAGVGCLSYLLSKLLFFIVIGALQALALIVPMVWTSVSDWAIHISPADMHCAASTFWVVVWLGLVAGSCLGIMISCLCLFIRSKGEIVAMLMVILMTLPQILFSEKVLGTNSLADSTNEYHSFGLVPGSPKIAQVASYGTMSRYLYLPLKAANVGKGELRETFAFNGIIIVGFSMIWLTVAWIALEIFIYRQKRRTHW